MSKYFNRKDFTDDKLNERSVTASKIVFDSAEGKQTKYDVFISHSNEDKDLVLRIRNFLEKKYKLSAYIDWDEDAGTSRANISKKVKAAMDISNSLIYVKTSNADESQWTAWEIGRYDAKNHDRIGVLPIEDDDFNEATWKHHEFLKDYVLLGPEDIEPFVRNGAKELLKAREKAIELNKGIENKSLYFDAKNGKIKTTESGKGTSTKFYGDKED